MSDQPTAQQILYLLKTRGPQLAGALADLLGITPAGTRAHLADLSADGLVEYREIAAARGRPKHLWALSARGHAKFPDRHSDIAALLIDGIRQTLGPAALDGVIQAHEHRQTTAYSAALAGTKIAKKAVEKLAALRTREGYMARAKAMPNGEIQLIEDHCPICVAAAACQGFCRAELAVFKAVLAPFGEVRREDHLLTGARRCSYVLTPGKSS